MVDIHHAPAHFDVDRSRLILQPKMFWAIIIGGCMAAFSIGGLVYQTHSRIANVETSISEMRDEIKADRESMQSRKQAYIDCLEAERANKGFRCPMVNVNGQVVAAPAPAPKPKVKRTSESSSWWPTFAPAQAKGK